MAVDNNKNIDYSMLSPTDVASLTPEQKTEYVKYQIEQRNKDIQAGIDASLQGNKAKLEELKAKFADGRAKSTQLFKDWYAASDTVQRQSNTVWSANRSYKNSQSEFSIWNNANQGALAFQQNNNIGDLTTFSGGTFGTPITDPTDKTKIANQQSFIGNRVDLLNKKMQSNQEVLFNEQATLAQNKDTKNAIDSDLTQQIWQNKMTVEDMKTVTEQLALFNLYKNQQ